MPTTDDEWADLARDSREALRLLGWGVAPRCLPDEPSPCGHGFADHAAAYLVTLMAVAQHHLLHTSMPSATQVRMYSDTLAKLSECDLP